MESVIKEIRSRVDPSDNERENLQDVAGKLESRVQEVAGDLDFDVTTVQTGSTARGTWVSGDRDIDLFIEFDSSLSEESLESRGTEIGELVLPDGVNDFASHPYRKGEVDGFDIDLVPCFAVDTASDIKSAVDRTPFHTRYLEPRLNEELASDVRVAKMFLKGTGAYGSDVRTQGFSGFLTELLVIEEGGFISLLQAAQDWDLPVNYDPENHASKTFDDSLVVIDPTDPERNVAANLSRENLLRFQLNARLFFDNPNVSFFERVINENEDMVRSRLENRGSEIVSIEFPRPNVVEDTLFPQLRRTRNSLVQNLENRGFGVIRSTEMANDDTAVVFLDMENTTVPNVETVEGPPVNIQDGVDNFLEEYENNGSVVGPFIDGDRLVVERQRDFTDASDFIRSDDLFASVAMGADIESEIRNNLTIQHGDDAIDELISSGFTRELTAFFEPEI